MKFETNLLHFVLMLIVAISIIVLAACGEDTSSAAEAHLKRGATYAFLSDDYDKAIVEYNKAIDIDPKFAAAYHMRGMTHALKQDYDKAISDLNKAIELDPNNTEYKTTLEMTKDVYSTHVSSWNCERLSEEVTYLSREKADSFKPEILKIYEIRETFRSSSRVECSGRARLSSGIDSNFPLVAFHIEQDEDGDLFYGYEIDPY